MSFAHMRAVVGLDYLPNTLVGIVLAVVAPEYAVALFAVYDPIFGWRHRKSDRTWG